MAENGENQAANRRVGFVQAFKLNQIKKNLIQVSGLMAWENKFHNNVGIQMKYNRLAMTLEKS